MNPGAASRLQILLPGEAARSGVLRRGKYGSAIPSVRGRYHHLATVNLTDAYFNPRAASGSPRSCSTRVSYQAYPTFNPQQATLGLGGTNNLSMTIQRASMGLGWTVQATTTSGSALAVTGDVSSPVVVVATTTDRLQLVLPGQTAEAGLTAGNVRGLLGTPSAAVAGSPYIVTVNLTDRFYNLKTDFTPPVQIQTTDPYDIHPATLTLLAGSTAYTVVFHTAPGPWTIDASTTPSFISTLLQNFTSAGVTVNPGPGFELQVLMPGETAVPGKPPYDSGENGGKIGTPDYDGDNSNGIQPFVAGATFTVSVNSLTRSSTAATWTLSSCFPPPIRSTTWRRWANDRPARWDIRAAARSS